MSYLTREKLFEVTDGGLDIILSYYPDAIDSVNKKNRLFKVRTAEKTASANIICSDTGIYYVTDFGGDQKPRDAIGIVMLEENIEFKEAMSFIQKRFNIAPDGKQVIYKEELESRPAEEGEPEGSYSFDIATEFTEKGLATLFARYAEQDKERFVRTCDRLFVHQLNSFTYVKNRVAYVTKATADYPIFIIEGEGFKKIYQPQNGDKKYRFRYTGTRPKDYVYGLKQCISKYNEINKEYQASLQNMDGEGSMGLREQKLPEIILCSGDRDALNVAAMGFQVIWLNSESATLTPQLYKQLMKYTDRLYNLPDIDATGVKQGAEMALKYLDIHSIWLPQDLRKRRDFRGNPCKDVRDYLKYYRPQHFKDLLKVSVPCRMYDTYFSKEGAIKYNFNNVQTYEFLRLSGFYRFKSNNEKEGYIYIHIQGNVVEEIKSDDVKDYVNNFLTERKESVDVRNVFFRTNQLNTASISNLSMKEIDFDDFDKNRQILFFENATWEVSKKGITHHRPGEVDKFVWKDEVIPHKVKKLDPFFDVRYDPELDRFKLDIFNSEGLFFKYLINSSRVHWRKELEEGVPLTEEEKYEQDLHLINKMYALGYLLHRYKDPSKPWCIYAMDHKITEQGESHGGSGKSIAFKSPRYFMKSVTLDGRNPKLTDNPHIYERVTVHTDYILVDDANMYLKFNFFFAPLTGELTVNPKNNKQFEIPFEQVPKFCVTSNYTLREIDPSTERRLLYTVFSDYYHYDSNGEYNESRSPKDDFSKNLFLDFSEDEWNDFFNFMAQCIQLYLTHEKINPPMDNVQKRNLQTIMTEPFKNWADVYFSESSETLNRDLTRKDAFDDFQIQTKIYKWSSNKFLKAMKAWCLYNNYILNPKHLADKSGRIIRKIEGQATEVWYVQTPGNEPVLIEPGDLSEPDDLVDF